MAYNAPLQDMRFVLETICDLKSLEATGDFEDLSEDLIAAILEEAGKFASGVFAPLNQIGDRQGSVLENGAVRTPEGFQAAYRQFVEGGWNCLSGPQNYGGQGLPFALQIAVQETITSANMAFALLPMLSQGAIEALIAHGTEAQQKTYLPKLVTGEWSGTMNLTEPQAGSDVGALKTKAEPLSDGSYKISGGKIFITWGEHDCVENIIHLVLARLPDAPAGTKGISLFLVPKFLVKDDGGLGDRNDLRVVSLEHKMGIHASPTCVMSYGDNDNCIGYLIGEENRGMACMFTMMNNARIGVGLQGLAIAARAYQAALSYAQERVQSAKFGAAGRQPVRIIEHPDVRRMLMTMKAQTEAARAIIYLNAMAVDRAHHEKDEKARAEAQGLADLLTPISKAHSTDIGVEVASLAMQVFGGMGYIEEAGVAQHYRDARIAPIYEGTNGIQALDLVGRKLPMAGGIYWQKLFEEMDAAINGFPADYRGELASALDALKTASHWLAARPAEQSDDIAAAASVYLRLFGTVLGGYLLAKEASAALDMLEQGKGDQAYLDAKCHTADFYMRHILPHAKAHLASITAGAGEYVVMPEAYFS